MDDPSPAGEPRAPNLLEHMPDHVGQALVELLGAKFGDRGCEMCGADKWTVNPSLATPGLVSADYDELAFGSTAARVHPCAMVHCTDCGNTKLLSLHHLGFDLVKAYKGGNDGQ